jgi:hypothetical protein
MTARTGPRTATLSVPTSTVPAVIASAGAVPLDVGGVAHPPYTDADTWARFRSKVVETAGCHIWVGAIADDGYGRFWDPSRVADQVSSVVRVSRWVWAAHNGPIDSRLVVMHDCDLQLCAREDHLLLGTQADNLAMAVRRDRAGGPHRWGRADRRGQYRQSLAVRTAVLHALRAGVTDRDELACIVAATILLGDPLADQLELF